MTNDINTKAYAQTALECLDLTDLSDHCTNNAIQDLIERGKTPFGHVAAICIWPEFITFARQVLGKDHPIQIATVVNFPTGDLSIADVVKQTTKAINDGANEIDLVIPWKALKTGDIESVQSMIRAVSHAIPRAECKLKTILETGELASEELIKQASQIAIDCGADFIKTSTGKVAVNATPQSARIMLNAIAQSGKDISFKPAGGVRTVADAVIYLDLAKEILGPDWVNSSHFRFGASGLLNDVLAVLSDQQNDGGEGDTY